MISKRFVLYFDTREVQLKRLVKTLLRSVLQCVCLRVYIYARVSVPRCVNETSPEGYPFALITLMKLVEGEGQRAFL